ncbi:MAG TPA: potassium/proton antiporter [Acidimicrobiales bacterium]|nr:potassium/proton antiporter [Acidimicrobiales bacterium]
MSADPLLLGGAVLVLAGVLASRVASRLGIPVLLLFLGVGMLAGSDGPGGIHFDDAELAQAVGIAALALILFDGGLSTRWSSVRPVLGPGAALATVSVGLTAGVTGAAAAWILDVPLEVGLLLGAIVSSTDAAAVFSVLRARNAGLRGGIQPLLELESGANDPMAVFLTIGLVELVSQPDATIWELVPMLGTQLVIGAALGIAGGWATRAVVNRIDLGVDGLYPVLTLAAAVATYAGTALAGGSGFLAVYLCGIWIGNRDVLHRNSVVRFHDAIAWLSQIGMFLVLGLLVFPSRLPDVAADALLIAAVLALVARPLGTVVTLTPFRVPAREQAVVAWVGLRGATPIILATFPLVEGVPEAQLLFDVVFFVVLTSVLVQGTTVELVARLFGATQPVSTRPPAPLEAGQPMPDGTALREVRIPPQSFGDGRALVELRLPQRALLVLVDREGTYIVPTGSTELEGGDVVLLLADDDAFERTRTLLTAPDAKDSRAP